MISMNKILFYVNTNGLCRDEFFYKAINNLGLKQAIIEKNIYGKPFFKNYPNMFFSLSHSREMIGIVFYNQEIGLDIQKITKASENMIKRCLCKSEIKLINLSKNKDKDFIKIWTMKEAYIKFCGLSILTDLSKINVISKNYVYSEILGDYAISMFIEEKGDMPEICLKYI